LRRSIKRVASVGFGTVAVALGVSLLAANAASAAPTANAGGPATFSVTGTNLPSATVFNLNLPTGSVCANPGSTGALYASFLVPAGTDLTSLTYKTFPPQADQGTALTFTGTGGFLTLSGPANSPAGQIDPLYATQLAMAPLVSSSVGKLTVSGTELPAGVALIPTGQTSANWEAGIACFDGTNNETNYWSVPLTFTVAANDPSGFVWTPNPGSGPALPEAPLAVGLPLGGVLVLAGAVFINRRRRRIEITAS
jgi:hypothetical protein